MNEFDNHEEGGKATLEKLTEIDNPDSIGANVAIVALFFIVFVVKGFMAQHFLNRELR